MTVSAFAGASTYALGEVFKKHFETGGTILDFDPARLRKLYKEKFEKGKKIVEEWRQQEKKDAEIADTPYEEVITHAPSAEVLTRLKELADLKAQGVLSEEEFER
ncbi:SHOCT domain-containing protein, partial [Arthrospira platensis SPKY1]|nr:SHOCT domain-containing protein [Arthrospira platensis SPKY1]